MMCLMFLIVFYGEFFIMNRKRILIENKSRSLSSNRQLIHGIKTWIRNLRGKTNTNSSKIYYVHQNQLNPYDEFFHSNKSFYFFNSTETFHKLFQQWLTYRKGKLSIKIAFTLNHKHVCGDRGRNLSIIIAVTSSASHLESRSAIRETWGGYARRRGAKVLFF